MTLLTGTTRYAASVGTSPHGTVDPVTVTGVTPIGTSMGRTLYEVHGSGSATLVTPSGGGNVRMTYTF